MLQKLMPGPVVFKMKRAITEPTQTLALPSLEKRGGVAVGGRRSGEGGDDVRGG